VETWPRPRALGSPGRLALALAVAGCSPAAGQSTRGSRDGGHTPLPQVPYQGGGLLPAPKVVTVTFQGDPMAADLQAFGQGVAASSWWNTVRTGYCVTPDGVCAGDGPAGTAVALPEPPASSYSDSSAGGPSTLQAWLASAITGGSLPSPDHDAVTNTIYTLYFPATTTITFDGTQSCANMGFDGYHNSMTMGAQQVVYVVVDECSPLPSQYPDVKTVSLLQSTTLTASHEIVEAATDPSALAYGYYLDFNDRRTWCWIDVAGGEIADLCVDLFGLNQDETTDGPYTAQRIWSNAQAAGGHDPCNPIPGGQVYFNAAPRDQVLVVAVGSQVTLDVDAFSDAPTAAWTLSAQDWSPSSAPYLAFSIAGGAQTRNGPQISVNDGSTVQVTVTLLQDPGSLAMGEADGAIVSIAGDPSSPTAAHYWPFIVLSPADAVDAGVSGTESRRQRPGPFHRYARPRAPRSRDYWKG